MGAATVAGTAGTQPAGAGTPERPVDRAGPGSPLAPDRRWRTALARSLPVEHDYRPRIEGALPVGLAGRLFRNGPGLFERGGQRQRNLLDGDGMIQCFDLADGRARYRNRFVRTEKFLEEEAAGVYLSPTWTTPAPGGLFANLGSRFRSQAGVATLVRNDQLLALDEGTPQAFYALDPATLDTRGPMPLPGGLDMRGCKAHTKTDPRTGDWYVAATDYGRHMTLRWLALDRQGAIKAEGAVRSPRMTYIHDFLVTERYLLFVLHAVEFSPFGMLAGLRTFADSLAWKPEQGNLVLVQDKAGGAPLLLEAPAAWMWHALNAYERGSTLVADFVGYATPDHFIGPNPAFAAVVRGEEGAAEFPGHVRRYLINPKAKTLQEETVAAGHHEFPMIDPRVGLDEHRYGYFACGRTGEWILDGVARLDLAGGARDEFRFGPQHFVGEPIFAPRGPGEGDGWILTLVQSGEHGRSFLAVFEAAALAAGPVAKVHLRHHTPISFHGYWQNRA
jgi:all-trans-8'-apo-beta-carotenal 15,15'-oxygenase